MIFFNSYLLAKYSNCAIFTKYTAEIRYSQLLNFSKVPHHVVSYIFKTSGMESLSYIIELGSLIFSDVTIFEQLLRSNLFANSISRFLSGIKSDVKIA